MKIKNFSPRARLDSAKRGEAGKFKIILLQRKILCFSALRRFISILLIIGILQGSMPYAAFAQSETPSPTPDMLQESVPGDLNGPSGLEANTASNSPSPVFDTALQQQSASLRKPPHVRKLRQTFRANEAVTVTVDFVKAAEVEASVLDAKGQNVNADIDVVSDTDPASLRILPPRNFRPGKYELRVTTPGGQLVTQEFTWGVLAINTNKSIYANGERAQIAMAVLDEYGKMVCNADVTLEITSPSGVTTVLTTRDKTIIINRECFIHAVTQKPDYETSFLTQGVGGYEVKLSAETKNGTYTIQDSFEVRDPSDIPFDVERVSATRIFPPVAYTMEFPITAHEDFSGTITEVVPEGFTITSLEGTTSYTSLSVIQAAEDKKQELSAPIFDLGLPYKGTFYLTQGFGGLDRDPVLKRKYAQYGVVGHDGADFALPLGTEVVAVAGGKIVIAREKWDYGTTIVIQHSWGKSYYGHLSKLSVKEGDIVKKGDTIAYSGNTGLSTAPHLHVGIKPNGAAPDNGYFGKINPLPYLKLYKEDELNPEAASRARSNGNVQVITWNVTLKKGDAVRLGYTYKTPSESPQFYLLGPLQFRQKDISTDINRTTTDITLETSSASTSSGLRDNGTALSTPSAAASASGVLSEPTTAPSSSSPRSAGTLVFQEARQWQLAIDPDTSIVLDNLADGTCGSGCWTIPEDWTDVNTIYAIGGGGAGDNSSTSVGVGGGGGGAFASITNLDLNFGDTGVVFGVGAAGTDGVNGGPSWFNAANAAACTDSATCVKGAGGTTATSATGGAGGSLAGTNTVGTARFAGGAGGTGNAGGDDSAGGGGGAGSPSGTGGTGGDGDNGAGGDEGQGGGGGSGCDSIGTANDGVAGAADGGAGGDSCFASGGTGGVNGTPNGDPGSNGSGGGGGDGTGNGGLGGAGVSASDPSLAGGGGGGGDDDTGGVGGDGGSYGGGGGGGTTVGTGGGGVVVIVYTPVSTGPTNDQLMRHGAWFSNGVEKPFTF